MTRFEFHATSQDANTQKVGHYEKDEDGDFVLPRNKSVVISLGEYYTLGSYWVLSPLLSTLLETYQLFLYNATTGQYYS